MTGSAVWAMGTVTKLFFVDVVVGRLCASVMQCMWLHVGSGQGTRCPLILQDIEKSVSEGRLRVGCQLEHRVSRSVLSQSTERRDQLS